MNVKDSGKREEFNTGSRRDTQDGKGRYDLLPMFALQQLSKVYEEGAKKYGEHNWRKGQKVSRYFSSALRHLMRAAEGWTDEPHLAQAMWNVAAILETREAIRRGLLPPELDDHPSQLLPGTESPHDPPPPDAAPSSAVGTAGDSASGERAAPPWPRAGDGVYKG